MTDRRIHRADVATALPDAPEPCTTHRTKSTNEEALALLLVSVFGLKVLEVGSLAPDGNHCIAAVLRAVQCNFKFAIVIRHVADN